MVSEQLSILERLRDYYNQVGESVTKNILQECWQINRRVIQLNLLSVFGYTDKQVYLSCYEIKALLESSLFQLEVTLEIPYNQNKIVFILKGKQEMLANDAQLNFIIPYGYRENYIDFIYDVTNQPETEVTLFVNNIPYSLECLLFVETKFPDNIRQMARNYQTHELQNGKSIDYYFKEMRTRQWNMTAFSPVMDKEQIAVAMNTICYFKSIAEYEKEGYSLNRNYRKVFISYSHKDEEKVVALETRLKDYGIPVWRDSYDIAFGESITEKISEGMQNSSIFLLCLSQHTKESLYAKQEMETLYNQFLIYRSEHKIVIPVKLDDVNPNDLILGLNNFKYCNYQNEKDIEQLVTLLMRETKAF
ncbi:toll/interleukin-1 receptor domain-containing protein [uncultured Streptococcus sp.]|uniref:toll/interleukin-1 receptor domain-containing protein n=1 Tax=uncultured Streptococcus sp. TaxID=83427 RepID=UPI002592DCBB|nr:toll/interleukin-1 receptor domain-containing protein [uncultured Streptococcus sp.]